MVCIHCGSKTRVINSRSQKRLNQIWRRRQCTVCKSVFTSEESAHHGAAWAVRDRSGHIRPFSRDKLFLSLYESCRHRPSALADATGLTATVIAKLLPLVNDSLLESRVIAHAALVALNRFDGAASVQYQAFHP